MGKRIQNPSVKFASPKGSSKRFLTFASLTKANSVIPTGIIFSIFRVYQVHQDVTGSWTGNFRERNAF